MINSDFKSNLSKKDISISNQVRSFITKRNVELKEDNSLKMILNNNANIAYCEQTHSDNVQFVKSAKKYLNTDGLVTHLKFTIKLMIQTADCIPIFLCDDKK